MTDFYTQLERQLVAAAGKRAQQSAVRRSIAGRRPQLLAALAAAAVVVVAGMTVLPGIFTARDATPAPAPPTAQKAALRGSGTLAGIRVAVLNATTQAGRARDYAALLERRGATIATLGTYNVQGVDRVNRVRYRRGAAALARRVAAVLHVPEVTQATSADRALADGTQVIVIVGVER